MFYSWLHEFISGWDPVLIPLFFKKNRMLNLILEFI